MYQITMCYGYWVAGRHGTPAIFDMYFRTCPFKGQFCVFAGLSEVLAFINQYHFTDEQIAYLRTQMPTADEAFFTWLKSVDGSMVKVHAFAEGSVVFAREPLMRIEGPIAACQLLETTLLNLVNYASLVATNAARIRLAAGEDKTLIEMGLRRAQGPDGGMSASRYAYVGGFNASSNVLAGQLFGIKVSGTHAHAFVQSFTALSELRKRTLPRADGGGEGDFVGAVLRYRSELGYDGTNEGELAAFVTYCQAFPQSFLALVDTYDTLASGVPNFVCCALSMLDFGYHPLGIRLDSGDLATLSKQARAAFSAALERYGHIGVADVLTIVASNDISEESLVKLNAQGHSIDTFGIGTHLVTCQAQPALGCVYKLVECGGTPRIKLSQELAKVSVPGRKQLFRLLDAQGCAVADIMLNDAEVAARGSPKAGAEILCCHPLEESQREVRVAARVEQLYTCVWDFGRLTAPLPTLDEVRTRAQAQLALVREQHKRRESPEEYKVWISKALFEEMHSLWRREAPAATPR